ncbi:MAG: tetratricopeptide repeat protein [Verrucomicrobia bacterium]|nr:tetratricopeptide repeat protein [Verrucomicrobiota bacterium]
MSGVRASPRLRALAAAGLLGALLLAAYAGSLRGDFLWDDDLHITANPTIVGPLGLTEIWTSARAHYFPLVLTNFWVQHQLWGLEPLGYRLVTLLCHAGAALLLWRLLLGLGVPGAWLGAALWALHPVQVESVAWICELKNTQSALLFLAAALCHLRWLDTRGQPGAGRAYAAALACAALAILSKPSTVMLPVTLALIGWWRRRALAWADLWPLVPFLALSAAAAGWTIWEQRYNSGALGPEWSQTPAERLILAGRVVWFYLGKLAWPEPLVFIYPRWSLAAGHPLSYLPGLGVVAALALLWRFRARPAAAAGFLAAGHFAALLFPVMGFFNVYFFRYSFVGDHFQYLASIGPLTLAGAWLSRWRPVAAVAVVTLAALSFREAREYVSSETLWRSTLAQNPGATMAWLNLGDTLQRQGRTDEAIAIFRSVLERHPDNLEAHNDLAGAHLLQGRPADALPHLERAVALAPGRAEFQKNLGNALQALGRAEAALGPHRRALELDPRLAEARAGLGFGLVLTGRAEEGLAELEQAVREAPRHAGVRGLAARGNARAGRAVVARGHFEAAAELDPGSAEAQNNLGTALALNGELDRARACFTRALQLAPGFTAARFNLANALLSAGRWAEAAAEFRVVAAERPADPEVRARLAGALANSGDLPGAVTAYTAALASPAALPEWREQYAQVLRALGRPREALEQLELATAARRTRR